MFIKKISEEARFTFIIVITLLMVPLLLYLLNLYTESGTRPPAPREMTVIVTEAEKKDILKKLPTQSIIKSIREAIKQGNNSTAYLQVGNIPKASPENEELRKALEKDAKARNRPGIRKEAENPQNPIRYFDESSPRDRSEDALYVYLVDIYGTIWPRICIQSVAQHSINISYFTINVDGRIFTIQPTALKTEKHQNNVSEYYDALLDKQSYSAVRALITSRKASVICVGTKGKREMELSEKGIKGLARILDTYAALGGNFAFIQPAAALQKKNHAPPARQSIPTVN